MSTNPQQLESRLPSSSPSPSHVYFARHPKTTTTTTTSSTTKRRRRLAVGLAPLYKRPVEIQAVLWNVLTMEEMQEFAKVLVESASDYASSMLLRQDLEKHFVILPLDEAIRRIMVALQRLGGAASQPRRASFSKNNNNNNKRVIVSPLLTSLDNILRQNLSNQESARQVQQLVDRCGFP